MFGLSEPQLPKSLDTEDDYSKLKKVIDTGKSGKVQKALWLIAKTGNNAARAIPIITHLLEDPEFKLMTASILWGIEHNPRAAEIIRDSVGSPKNPNTAILGDLIDIARVDSSFFPILLEITKSQIEVIATASGSGSIGKNIVNAFTSGDDNKAAREASAILAIIAWGNDILKDNLISTIKSPQNEQQKKYAALALGFATYMDQQAMLRDINFMNRLFNSPDITLISTRNKIRDDALSAGYAYAMSSSKKTYGEDTSKITEYSNDHSSLNNALDNPEIFTLDHRCSKCGSDQFDYDRFWNHYTCNKCGWIYEPNNA